MAKNLFREVMVTFDQILMSSSLSTSGRLCYF